MRGAMATLTAIKTTSRRSAEAADRAPSTDQRGKRAGTLDRPTDRAHQAWRPYLTAHAALGCGGGAASAGKDFHVQDAGLWVCGIYGPARRAAVGVLVARKPCRGAATKAGADQELGASELR